MAGDGITVTVEGDRAPEGRIVTLRSADLPELPTGRYYELWFLPDDGSDRISAGTFHPDTDGDTLVVLHAAVDPTKAGALEVTDGPAEDGVGEVVARGEVRLRG